MLVEHLPILPVLLPLFAAPVALIIGRSNLAWMLSTTVSIAAFFVALNLLSITMSDGAIRYALGGWAPPWGIEMRIDTASAFVLLAVASISTQPQAARMHSQYQCAFQYPKAEPNRRERSESLRHS